MAGDRTTASAVPLTRSWFLYLGTCSLVLTAVFVGLGPSATEGRSLIYGVLFWFSHVSLAMALLAVCQLAVTWWLLPPLAPPLIQVIVAGLLGTVVFTPVALGLDVVFDLSAGDAVSLDDGILQEIAKEVQAFALPLLGCWVLVNGPKLIEVSQGQKQAAASKPDGEEVEEPASALQPEDGFWKVLPAKLGRDVIAVSAELHYLRIYSASGEALVLFSFGRALETLGQLDGMQIHRSHWIALPHVDRLESNGGKVLCHLDSGLALPVSRPYRPVLREALRAQTV